MLAIKVRYIYCNSFCQIILRKKISLKFNIINKSNGDAIIEVLLSGDSLSITPKLFFNKIRPLEVAQ